MFTGSEKHRAATHDTFTGGFVTQPQRWLRRTCREAAALLIAREDRALALSDTVALKLHLLACKACPKFENQLLTVRSALGQWRRYGDESAGAQDGSPGPERKTL